MALPGTLPFTLGGSSTATITAVAGTPTVSQSSLGLLPWTLPVTIGGVNTVMPSGATIAATPGSPSVEHVVTVTPGAGPRVTATAGTPTVAEAVPVQSPLPWTLPIVLGGPWQILPAPARIETVGSTPEVSGEGFPYTFPFSFPPDVVITAPAAAVITAIPSAPTVTGTTPAITPITTTIYAEPGAPLITGPGERTLSPGPATITTEPGTPGVQTVQSVTTVFLVDGSQTFIDWDTGALDAVGANPVLSTLATLINSKTCTVQKVGWPDTLPMATGLNIGANNLAVAIANCNTAYVLVGYGEGAAICSMALQRIQSGALEPLGPVGAVMFGNPCRQGGAIAPVQTDPGGGGIWAANRITQTPTWWWEFALPGDVANTVPNTGFGADLQTMFTALLTSYTGGGDFVMFLLNSMASGVTIHPSAIGQLTLFLAITAGIIPAVAGIPGFAAHAHYHDTAPPGAAATCVQLAANYINEVTAQGTVRATDTIAPGGVTISAIPGTPFVADVISPSGATASVATSTPTVTAPDTIMPGPTTIATTTGTRAQTSGLLPWQLPVLLGA